VTGSITPSSPRFDGLQGSTSFNWVASSPSPSGDCKGYTPVATITNQGTIQNNGCDRGPGTWSDSSGGGPFTMTKPADIPDGEITSPVGFGSSGVYVTVAQFRQTLTGTAIFDGRQVSEQIGFGGSDSCYYPGSPTAPYQLHGGWWNVGYYFALNVWADDYVGWTPDTIADYRANMRVPCSASAVQVMVVAVTGQSGSTQQYRIDTLGPGIPDAMTITATRDGVTQSKTWP
jgi:hypothetical protein